MSDPPVITAAATASPPHRFDRETMKAWCRRLYGDRRELPAMLRVIEHSAVEVRSLALPPERIVAPRGFGERNAEYTAAALALAETAARRALDRAGLEARAVDY